MSQIPCVRSNAKPNVHVSILKWLEGYQINQQIYFKIVDMVFFPFKLLPYLISTNSDFRLIFEHFPISVHKTLFLKKINIIEKMATTIQSS